MCKPILIDKIDELKLFVYTTRDDMGKNAANQVANCMKALLEKKDIIRMVFAAAPSQSEFLYTLTRLKDIPWDRVDAFHMDEYIGLEKNASQRFSNFLNVNLFDIVKPRKVNLLTPSMKDPELECERYTQLLEEGPIDIICLGIGENGHIAFNDPPVADFNDPRKVKIVELDQMCRQQQVNDGCFTSIEEVPTHAVTLTIPTMLSGENLFCIVPGKNKREAVKDTLIGDITTDCPASILRTHKNCNFYVDSNSFPL